jgi:hypothetical protein
MLVSVAVYIQIIFLIATQLQREMSPPVDMAVVGWGGEKVPIKGIDVRSHPILTFLGQESYFVHLYLLTKRIFLKVKYQLLRVNNLSKISFFPAE